MFCGEGRLVGVGGGEAEGGAGREVVEDLEHRRALVAGARLAGQHVDAAAGRRRLAGPASESTPSERAQILTPGR